MNSRPYVNRRTALGLVAVGLISSPRTGLADLKQAMVYQDSSCGCCKGWISHLRDAGFTVKVQELSDLKPVKARLGVPKALTSCHTAEISGYVIEGHVPVAAIQRLLDARPKALGLAVPGMPLGSPGMEGGTPEAYDVLLFTAEGHQSYLRFIGTKPVT